MCVCAKMLHAVNEGGIAPLVKRERERERERESKRRRERREREREGERRKREEREGERGFDPPRAAAESVWFYNSPILFPSSSLIWGHLPMEDQLIRGLIAAAAETKLRNFRKPGSSSFCKHLDPY